MKTRTILKTLIGVFIIGAGVTYFVFQAMQSSWAYYYSVDDFVANSAAAKSYSLRLAGRVKEDSIRRDAQKTQLGFTLAGSKNGIPVEFSGTVPDNFTAGGEVVVEGRMDPNGVFQARNLMTKCESKYKAKEQ